MARPVDLRSHRLPLRHPPRSETPPLRLRELRHRDSYEPARPAPSRDLRPDPRTQQHPTGEAGRTLWNEHAVNVLERRGLEQGFIDQPQIDRHSRLAAALPATEPHRMSPERLAGLAREAGMEAASLDPAQLRAASRYINDATDAAGLQERLRKSLNSLHILQRGLPRLAPQEIKDLLWGAARVPGHALERLDDAGLARAFQQVAQALATPGRHELRLDRHTLKMVVSTSHQLVSSETKAPGFFAKLGSALKTIGGKALAVASFIPGPVGIAARVGSAVLGAVRSIKSGSFLGAIAGIAGSVAGGAGALFGKAAGGLSRMAETVSRTAHGIQAGLAAARAKSPAGLLGAAASIGGSLAGLAADASGAFATSMRRVATWAGRGQRGFQVMDGMRQGDLLGAFAGGASLGADIVGEQGHARLAGNLRQVSDYAATVATVTDSIQRGDYLAAGAAASRYAASEIQDPRLAQRLRLAASTLTRAGTVKSALGRRDWLGATAAGSKLAADLTANADLDDAHRVLQAVAGLRAALRGGDDGQFGLQAKELFDTVRGVAASIQERHFPSPVAPTPLSRRDFGDLMNAVPGVVSRSHGSGSASGQSSHVGSSRFAHLAGIVPGVTRFAAATESPEVGAPGDGISIPSVPLRRGARGPAVERLQEQLLAAGYGGSMGAVDGIFGPATAAAVVAFQRLHGIQEPPGVVGLETAAKLIEVAQLRQERRAELELLRHNLTQQIELDRKLVDATRERRHLGAAVLGASLDLGRRLDALERALDDPTTEATSLRRLQAEVTEARNDLGVWIRQGERSLDAALEGLLVAAETAKLSADATMKAFKRAAPALYVAYKGLTAAAERVATDGEWAAALRTGLVHAGGAGIDLVQVDGLMAELVKETSGAVLDYGHRIYEELSKIEASSPEEYQRLAREIVERNVAGAVAKVSAARAFAPLERIDPDSAAGKVIKGHVQAVLNNVLRDGYLKPLTEALVHDLASPPP